MKQLGLDDSSFVKQPKKTRKAQFLAEMDRVVPWSRLIALIEPHYPKPGKGRRPIALDTMLRIHFMQQWFAYSDPAMEEALHDIPLVRRFAGLDAAVEGMPDETTILKFRHLLEPLLPLEPEPVLPEPPPVEPEPLPVIFCTPVWTPLPDFSALSLTTPDCEPPPIEPLWEPPCPPPTSESGTSMNITTRSPLGDWAWTR